MCPLTILAFAEPWVAQTGAVVLVVLAVAAVIRSKTARPDKNVSAVAFMSADWQR